MKGLGTPEDQAQRPARRELEDEQLVRAIQEGIEPDESFWILFERYYGPLFQFFLNKRFQSDDAHDLVQDTLLRVYRSIGYFRGDSKFRSWLLSIASNVWRNELRRRHTGKREAQEVSLEDSEEAYSVESSEPSPLQERAEREERQLLAQALEQLPPAMRKVVLLRAEGMKIREIADVLSISIPTVKAQLYQAKLRLEKSIPSSDGIPSGQ